MSRNLLLRLVASLILAAGLETAAAAQAYNNHELYNHRSVPSDHTVKQCSYGSRYPTGNCGCACNDSSCCECDPNCCQCGPNGCGCYGCMCGSGYGWQGKRRISYQQQKDLFYNYYVGPGPSGTTAQLYESPLPTPAFVGQTYVTYQPFMPHEYLYRHKRSYYTYNCGAGWTRTKVRYSTGGGLIQHWLFGLYGDHNSRFTDSLSDSVSGLNRCGRR